MNEFGGRPTVSAAGTKNVGYRIFGTFLGDAPDLRTPKSIELFGSECKPPIGERERGRQID
jgi:hypothetical protein